MDKGLLFIGCVIVLAFIFDFINGFHDAANSIATIVATGVLTPLQAVLWAAVFNFLAYFLFSLMVAKTIGSGLIDPRIIDPTLLFAALVGAIAWNVLTWFYGLPSSSSHALIGGLAGAAICKSGFGALQLTGFIKVGIGIFISPIIGLITGSFFCYGFLKLTKNNTKTQINRWFKAFQLASSALLSLTHGGNDAQKTMGIIALLLFSASWIHGPFYIPFWVVVCCYAVISLGTLLGGWRIVHTLGQSITKLDNLCGCAAETGAAMVLFISTEAGVPVSTTQTVTGAIVGVGLTKGRGGTHWPILRIIFLSWLLTIPAAGLVAAGIVALFTFFAG